MIKLAYGALWVFVFSLPWEALTTSGGVAIVSRLTGMLALGLALAAALISGRVRRWHLLHTAALLFVIWVGFGLFIAHPQDIPRKFYTFIQLFLMLWMIWELAPSRSRQRGLLTAYVFGAYVAALATIVLSRREAGALHRFAAGGGDPNDLAMTLGLALPMAWYLGMTYRQPLLRWVCRAYLPVGLLAIGLTGSRGGMLASTVALAFVPLSMTKLSAGRMVTAIAMLGISGALAVAYVPKTIVERLSTTTTEVEDLSIGGRFKLWRAGMHVFAERPVVGYGTSTFKQAITPELGGMAQVAHNSYVSVLVEEGLVGFVLYALMFIAVFVAVLDLPPFERRFALVLMAALCVAMAPLTWEDHKPVWFILAALLGMAKARVEWTSRAVRQPRVLRVAPMGEPPVPARSFEPLARRGRAADRDLRG